MDKAEIQNVIPIINVSSLYADVYETCAASDAIGAACRDVGFFYAVGHGISLEHQKNIFDEAANFFSSSNEQKNSILINHYNFYSGYVPYKGERTNAQLDSHEAFDMIREAPVDDPGVLAGHPGKGPNQWPAWSDSFKGAMLEHWEKMERLGKAITKGIFLSLNLEKELLNDYMRDPMSFQRILYYPGTKQAEQGIGAHKDYGFVTIVMQDRVGLEVRDRDNSWMKAAQVDNSFLINIGAMIQMWTNNLYPATEHRVLTSEQDRTSVVFFTGPRPEVIVRPLTSCCSQANPPKYEPYHYGEYVKEKFKASYGV